MKYTKTKGEEKEAAKKELMEGIKVMEEQLGNKPYFGGDNFGFVDVALVPLFCMFYTFTFAGKFIDDEKYPTITSWARRCIQKESVSKAIPQEEKLKQFLDENRLLHRGD
jgi:glutathione S-transferase